MNYTFNTHTRTHIYIHTTQTHTHTHIHTHHTNTHAHTYTHTLQRKQMVLSARAPMASVEV